METALLTPGTTAQNPVSPKGAPKTGSKDSSEFSPAMNEAVTSLEKGARKKSDLSGENSAIPITETLNNPDDTAIASSEVLLSGQGTASTGSQLLMAGPVQQSLATEALVKWIAAQESTPLSIQAGSENSAAAAGTKVETLLLQQIQHILDQGKNNGSIAITASNDSLIAIQKNADNLQNLSNSFLSETQNSDIQTRQVGIITLPANEAVHSTQHSAKFEGTHQEVKEQFYNAKLGESKTNNGNEFQQQNSEQKGAEQQSKAELQNTINQTSGNTPLDGKPGESSFGQQFSSSSTTTNTPAPIEGKLAPGAHHPVPEKDLVDNLIQRFNVNPRLQTSKLTMQLHPAELGALKIDILVKGDSIKANIVAQSQQVLETLDKQMPRLRAVLQEQGFTVDSFKISLESEGGNQKELFQEHFSSQQQEFASNRTPASGKESFDILLDAQKELDGIDEDSSGVNLTV